MSIRRVSARTLIVLGVLVASGCGDGEDTEVTEPSDELTVGAVDIDFDADEYQLPAGSATITLAQDGFLPHSLLIETEAGDDLDFRLFVGTGDEDDTATVELEPGTYTFYCDIVGHRAAGMEATVVVG